MIKGMTDMISRSPSRFQPRLPGGQPYRKIRTGPREGFIPRVAAGARTEGWRVSAFAVVLAAFILMGAAPVRAATAAAEESPPAGNGTAAPSSRPTGLAELIPRTAELAQRFVVLKKQLAAMPAADNVLRQLEDVEHRLEALAERLSRLQENRAAGYLQLVDLRKSFETLSDTLTRLSAPLTAGLRDIDKWRRDWQNQKAFWQSWRDEVGAEMSLPMVGSSFERSLSIIDRALAAMLGQMKPLMDAQNRIFETQVRINSLLSETDRMITAERGDFLRDASPPMFAPAYYAQYGSWLWPDLLSGLKRLSFPDRAFFIGKGWVMAGQLLLSLVVALMILRSGSVLSNSEELRFMVARPHAAGWLIGAFVFWTFYEPMPALWQLFLAAVITTGTARLAAVLFVNRRRIRSVYALVVVLLLNGFLSAIGFPGPLMRLYLVTASMGVALLSVYFLRHPSGEKRTFAYRLILFLTAVVGIAAAVIEIAGFSALSLYLFESYLRTIFIVLAAWLLMRLGRGLLEVFFRSSASQRIAFVRGNAAMLVDRAAGLINIFVSLLFVGAVLVTWRVFTTAVEPTYRLLAFGVTIGSVNVTVGLILAAAACLYGSLLASRVVEFILLRDVFARRRVDPGIGISIVRLLHYFIVLVGLLLALSLLGFQLTNLTIIASALSVGIGFGLQTIVNNFVCGLILLFERPVKVGDIIQLGEQWATIRKIGLRATVVQTFDRADIVVPNSELITNQVTNWTLADRNMRIILSVGVAYGSNVPLVLRTLQECTAEHPRVLKDPAPMIFFMGFGDSSLDFQVRVWIDDIDYMNVVRSELNQAIDRRFREEGVEIPFPQRDLHLRSVAPPAAESLASGPLKRTKS